MQKKSYNGIFGINKSFFFYLWRFLFISNDVLCIKRIDKFVFFIARGLGTKNCSRFKFLN